ncbi:RNA recognition motif domain-containing protein [Nitrospira sp. Nam74]
MMQTKLYITGIPFYVTETKLRALLAPCHIQSLTFIHTIHGDVGMVELTSLEDAQRVTATLSRLTLDDGCKLFAVPHDTPEGHALEQLAARIAKKHGLASKPHAAA